MKLVAVLSALVLAATASASAQSWDQAYARRDYRLGITLEEFRAITHPDQKEWPNAFPVCSSDAKAAAIGYFDARLHSEPLKKAGVVKCHFFYTYRGASPPSTHSAGLKLGDLNSLTDFFFITPPGASQPVLTWIDTGGPSEAFDSLLTSFQAAYGKPTSLTIIPWRNRAGATFDNTEAIWENAVSRIVFRRYGSTLKVFELRHELTPMMVELGLRLQALDRENAKKL